MLAFPELADNCIIIDSESKRYSMCGVRIGFMVTRSQKILDAAMKFAQARLSPVLIGQIIAAAAIMLMTTHISVLFVKNTQNVETF